MFLTAVADWIGQGALLLGTGDDDDIPEVSGFHTFLFKSVGNWFPLRESVRCLI